MRYSSDIQGDFALSPEGMLIGEVMNPRTKTVYAAAIQLR